MRKSIRESDYIFQLDEFSSLMKKEDITVKVAKNGYVFFADDETLGNNLLGFINPNTSNQKLHIKVPMSTVATLDEFENTKELVDFIISEYSHNKRKFESKKSVGKSLKESVDKTFFDWMCDKDFFKGISKQVTKKEKCQFDFYKTLDSYAWIITYKEDESLHIYMDKRTNDIFIHVNKNGKSGKDFKFPQLTFNDSVDELLDIIIRYVQGNFDSSWYESKKSARKSIKESMNLDYGDFDYKKFENWIIRYLEDYGCEVNTVEIICDDYGYDVEINVENGENLPSRISDKDYGAFIFDAMYTTNCLYLKMPIVRAMKIAEEFSPKVLKVNDDSILIGDKNSDTEIWLDVWTNNDGDEDYTEWDYNKQSFNLNNYEDMVQKYLQQIDDFFYILDGEVSDNFPLTESKKLARKSLKEMFDDEGIVDDFVDFLIYDCGYDEKTVEKYFYKKYKLNGLDTIPTKLYIKIKNEIEDVLGYNDII